MAQVFISYVRKDRAVIDRLAAELERRGYSIWWDVELLSGDDFRPAIEKELRAAKAVVVAWSSASVNSRFVRSEASYALRNSALLPIALEPDLELPLEFDQLQTTPITEWISDPLKTEPINSLCRALQRKGVNPIRQSSAEAAWSGGGVVRQEDAAAGEGMPAKIEKPVEPPPARQWVRISIGIAFAALTGFAAYGGYTIWEEFLIAERKNAEQEALREFKDCDDCPTMVVVPAGEFMMGSESGDPDEKPVHRVTISRPFAVGRFEVTFAEWDACVADRGCQRRPEDRGWGRDRRPVIDVSWDDAKAYVSWLSRRTGKTYRLLSEAEWEYAARGGSATQVEGKGNANCAGCGGQWDSKQTAPVGSFRANGFGLHDMIGNVWEWTEDCWKDSYHGAPADGSAWTGGECSRRVLRGGSWLDNPGRARSAFRSYIDTSSRYYFIGFRVARTL
jgi:formylglycine-generating enzyme required for sulfatase activity